MLDTAVASLGLMSQQADAGLVRATAPHACSYIYLSRGNPKNYLRYIRNFPARKETGLETEHAGGKYISIYI